MNAELTAWTSRIDLSEGKMTIDISYINDGIINLDELYDKLETMGKIATQAINVYLKDEN